MLSPPSIKRGVAWVTGWINMSGWIALVATNSALASTLIVNMVTLLNPTYEYHRWHQFLIYLAVTCTSFAVNAFMQRLLPQVNGVALAWSIAGFVIISITVLACAAPDYATGEYVFATWINETGWPDGIAFLLGLLQGGLGLTGFDAVAHMIEEIPDAAIEGPKIMLYCQYIGISTGFIFLIVVLFVSGGLSNAETVISSPSGPLLQIFYIATNNRAGAVCLLVFPLICFIFAGISVLTTASRMTFAFARDGGLPMSATWWKVHKTLGVPLNALLLDCFVVLIFGYVTSPRRHHALCSASRPC